MSAERRDPEATKGAILDAARKLFLAKGFADAATSEIAAEAGVTKSLIHHHFGSKQDLWAVVKEGLFESYCDLQQTMLEQAQEPSAELLAESLKAYFRFCRSIPEFSKVLAWTALEMDTQVQERESELTRLGVEKIREGQQAGFLRDDVDPRFILAMFWAVVEHHFLFRDRYYQALGLDDMKSSEAEDRYLDVAVKLFMEGAIPR